LEEDCFKWVKLDQPVELSSKGLGDGLADARLADARRADEAKDGAVETIPELPDGQVLKNPALYFFQSVVVGIQILKIVFGTH
jgi:hypothetical protein